MKFKKYKPIVIKIIFFILIILLIMAVLIQAFKSLDESRIQYICPNCNIILISIDTLRADHLGCYGYAKNTTPGIDEFSRDAVIFKTTIAQAPSTEASHASILTSTIPSHHGAFHYLKRSINKNTLTMAEILKSNEYNTVSFNGGGQIQDIYGFSRGFDLYESSSNEKFEAKVKNAINWLENNSAQTFFLFLHTFETHHPYTPTKKYMRLFENNYQGKFPLEISIELLIDINEKRINITDEDKQHIINAYDAEIKSMDDSFATLIAYLKKKNLYNNTVIIFTSDHGEEFEEHGMMGWHAHTLYDELLKVPLIIKFPESKFASKKIGYQVRSIDILPTVLDILNITAPETFDGINLVNIINGNQDSELYAISEIDGDNMRPISIRVHNKKLLVFPRIYGPEKGFTWFKKQAHIKFEDKHIDIDIAPSKENTTIMILEDGKEILRTKLKKEIKRISYDFDSKKKRNISIESITPCSSPKSRGINNDSRCLSFCIYNTSNFDISQVDENEILFFLLDRDKKELKNVYSDANFSKDAADLKEKLDKYVSKIMPVNTTEIKYDKETLEQLKALGYI